MVLELSHHGLRIGNFRVGSHLDAQVPEGPRPPFIRDHAKLDLLGGYAIAFGVVAAVQAGLVSVIGFVFLDLTSGHSEALVVALAIGNGILGMAMGLFASAFASTEFQVVQFMPAFILPQILLCGLFQPREEMAPALETASDFLPLTYSGLVRTPVVTTIHGFCSEKIVAVYQKYNHHVNYVSISNANRLPSLPQNTAGSGRDSRRETGQW